jgi:L-threonylcarbamoyladenylate synthase
MSDAVEFENCLADSGVAVFPSDTVYGLACDPLNTRAVKRLYGLKGRPLGKPSAVMFFGLELALEALPELGERMRTAMRQLLPGGLTLLMTNPMHRYPMACGDDPSSLGIRVPRLEWAAEVGRPVLQSSANLAGGQDPRRRQDVPEEIIAGVDLVIDGGELPGTSSTVLDLRSYEEDGTWSVIRQGAVGEAELTLMLGGPHAR